MISSQHRPRRPHLIMPLVFSQPALSLSPAPPSIMKSPSVRELIAQVEATSRVPFWRDPKQDQTRRSLYHTLSCILASDLSSDEDISDIYTSESLTESDRASSPRTLTFASRPSSSILRSTVDHEHELVCSFLVRKFWDSN